MSLLFVYAGDSGVVNALVHCAHKIVSPSTYECHLCALTNGPLLRRKAWSRALAELAPDATFLHHDELRRQYGIEPPLPAVFDVRDGRPELLISKAEIDACADLDALIALLRARVPATTAASAPAR
jgi:hypothetical protein